METEPHATDATPANLQFKSISRHLEALEGNLSEYRGRSKKNVELLRQAASLGRLLGAGAPFLQTTVFVLVVFSMLGN